MNKKTLTIVAIVVVTALVAGGGVYFLTSKKDTASSGTSNPTSTKQSNKKLEGNALVQAVLDKVKTATPTVADTRITDESNDSNNLIGKKGEYQYAGSFYDTRTGYKPTDDNLDPIDIKADNYKTTAGGSIEVFATNADAKKRGELLESFQSGVIRAGAYKVVGTVVLRASEDYTASQQQEMLTLMESAL
jgi:outer membrane murein-binding lipoprotein Lpp